MMNPRSLLSAQQFSNPGVGPMREKSERRAIIFNNPGKVSDLLIPVLALIVAALALLKDILIESAGRALSGSSQRQPGVSIAVIVGRVIFLVLVTGRLFSWASASAMICVVLITVSGLSEIEVIPRSTRNRANSG